MGFWEDHAGDRSEALCQLFAIDWSPVKYWTSATTDIVTDSGDVCGAHRWTVRPVGAPDGINTRQADVAGASLELGNADNVISAILFAGGTSGVRVHIFEAMFLDTNLSARPDGVRWIYEGRLKIPAMRRGQSLSTVQAQLGPAYDLTTKLGPTVRLTDLLRA